MEHERDRVLAALHSAAEQIAETNRDGYCRMLRRNRLGELTRTYALTEAHQRVLAAEWALQHCYIEAETAMAVLGEYEVLRERFGEPGLTHSLLPSRRPASWEMPALERVARETGWSS